MADPLVSLTAEKLVDLSNDREYLSEWPPANDIREESEQLIQVKRQRLDRAEDRRQPSVQDNYEGERVLWARPALAKWWRERQKEPGLKDFTSIPKSVNPNTVLKYVAGLPTGIAYLKEQINLLKKEIILHPASATHHAALASYYDLLKDTCSALSSLEVATKLDPLDKNIAWLYLKVQRSKELEDKKRSLQEHFLPHPSTDHKMPEPVEVERRHCNTLGAKQFLFEYCMTGTPVIITGLVVTMTTAPWDFKHIKEAIGNKTATLKRMVKESTEWAKLEPAGNMKVSEFIDSLQTLKEPLYLFDWSIPTHAPDLAEELRIPKYFAGDFLQRTAPGSLYRDSWPSLFIAPKGLHSDLHVDAFGSNFWMALFQGRKRWTFFQREDIPLLYPHYQDSLDLAFDVDLSCPDLDKFPLLMSAVPRQCILEPGELLFVPYGCPHRVENLEDSLAVSSNFVDLSNLHVVLEELRGNALIDPRSQDLLIQMTSYNFPVKMFSQQSDLSWKDFKTWPQVNYKDFDVDMEDLQNYTDK